MSRLLRIEKNGQLYLGSTLVYGQVLNVSVNGKIIIDSSKTEGSSGKKKVFSGFDDSGVSIKLQLLEQDDSGVERYTALSNINSEFKSISDGEPTIFSVQGDLFKAFKIKHVLFAELSVEDSNETDSLMVSLSFTEHNPVVAKVQEQQKPIPKREMTAIEADEYAQSQELNGKSAPSSHAPKPEGITDAEYRGYTRARGAF